VGNWVRTSGGKLVNLGAATHIKWWYEHPRVSEIRAFFGGEGDKSNYVVLETCPDQDSDKRLAVWLERLNGKKE
jgi:hypothetical protein